MVIVSKRATSLPVASRIERRVHDFRRSQPRLFRRGACVAQAGLLCLALSATGLAETVSLAELEQRAIGARGSVAASEARVGSAAARLEASRVPSRPTLGLGVQAEAAPGSRLVRVADASGDEYLVLGSRSLGDPGALTPDARYGATLSLESRLYDFGRTEAAVRAAQAEQRAAQVAGRAEQASVVREVRSGYLMWMLALGTRDILRDNAGGLTALRQSIEGRVAGGTLAGAEVAPARYEETRAALELSRADTEVQVARLALSRAAGLALGPDATPDFALLDRPKAAEAQPSDLKMEALEQQRSAALASASSHRKAAAPILSARADAGMRGQRDKVFPVYRVGVSLELPLLDGGASTAAAELATARAAELTALAREAQAQADFERAQLRAELSASETRIHLAQQLLEAAQASHQHAQDQQQLGGSALQELVRTQARVSTAKLELLTARVARANAALTLAGSDARPASDAR